MRRRDFIMLLAAAPFAPSVVRAQEKDRVYRLGSLAPSPRTRPYHVAFYEELKQQGFVEGQNLVVDEQGYGLHADQFAKHAEELVRAQVDLIICSGELAIRTIQRATKTIPIVGNGADLLGSGLVQSLAKPTGNFTGVNFLANELNGKRQEILTEAAPAARHVAVLADVNSSSPKDLQALEELAHARGHQFSAQRVRRWRGQSRRQRIPGPKRSTCWPRRCFLTLATSLCRASRRCGFPRSTNGQKSAMKADCSPMARASRRSTGTSWPGRSSRSCAAQSLKTFRRAADQIRVGRQPENRQGARPDHSGIIPAARR
jgi:hypothetical protein